MTETDPRSLPELVSTLVSGLADLVRKESQLVRAEVSEKVGQTARAGVRLAIGAALILGAFLVLLQALVLLLSRKMDPLWASLVVAMLVGIAGWAVIQGAVKLLQPASLKPDRSARQLHKDVNLVKGQTQ